MKRNFFIALIVILSLFSLSAAVLRQFPRLKTSIIGGGHEDAVFAVTSAQAVEKVSALKEVAYYSRMINLLPSNNGRVAVHVAQTPQVGSSGKNLYWKVLVGEVFGNTPDSNFEVWKQFAVSVDDGEILVFDRKQSKLVSVNDWRTQRNA